MNKFYTLEGNKYRSIPVKKINPDEPPKYYSDHEVGSWLSAALPSLKLSLPNIASLLPSFPPLPALPSFPPLPPLPPLPALPSFPPMAVPNAVISTPVVKLPTPTITVTPPKIDVANAKVEFAQVKVTPPPLPVKVAPPNQWKADPKDVKAVGETVKLVGDVTTIVGTGVNIATSWTGLGAGLGTTIMGAGAGLSSIGNAGIKFAETIETANKLKTSGVVAGLGEISKISKDLGYDKVSNITGNASSQGQNIQNALQSGNPSQVLNAGSNFLNSIGVAPSVANNLSSASSIVDQGLNILNSNTAILDQLKAKPLINGQATINRSFEQSKPTTTNKPFTDIFKDPINDPSHPLYVPPLPSQGKTNEKPSPIPTTDIKKIEKKDSNNMGILLIGVAGIFVLMNKKGKKK